MAGDVGVAGAEGVVGEEGDEEVVPENPYPPRMNWTLSWMLTVKYGVQIDVYCLSVL